MYIDNLKTSWESFGKKDPLWAILTDDNKKNGKWNVEEFFATGAKEIEGVKKLIEKYDLPKGKRNALDFGCGIGRLTQPLACWFTNVSGVDIAPSMIENAQRFNKHKESCKYILNTAPNLEIFEDNKYDFIYSNIVLQHIKPQYAKGYIKEFLRILAPGGMLIFQVPDTKISRSSVRGILRQLLPIPDSWLFSLKRRIFGYVMEMHCIKKDVIMELIQNNKGKIVDIIKDNGESAEGFISFRYFVTK